MKSKKDLKETFYELGIKRGSVVEVHSSLKNLQDVVGGAQSIIDALIEVIGYEGTIVMPLQNVYNSEPSNWSNPPIKPSDYDFIRKNTPGGDGKIMDIRHMGVLVNTFRNYSGVLFSSHPTNAFVAWGKYARLVVSEQSLDFPLSINSPCQKLYDLDAQVLLIDCDFSSATSLHLGEYISKKRPVIIEGAAVIKDGIRSWEKYLDIDLDSSDFINVEKIMKNNNLISHIKMDKCNMSYFSLKMAVKVLVKYL
ncbi:MAG: AAC(3) family N-acetyltransferase [Erysipelotrichaceae bacterium]